MDYQTLALVLIALGALLLLAEILVPTGGVLVVAALLFFALGVGTILYYGSTLEGVVAIGGLAVGLPAAAFAATAAWRRMSLDTVLDDPTAQETALAAETTGLKGRTGKTVSPMRPSGTVEFDGKRVDAMTEGMMLDAGVWVRCVEVRRGQVIVRRMEDPADVADIDPTGAGAPPAEPNAAPPANEQPGAAEPKASRDDFDDFDIGLDKT
jgi:membrane-bound ClpP family serine protease